MLNLEFSLPKLTQRGQNLFLKHATQVLEAQQQMTGEGTGLLHYTLRPHPAFERMTHYPKGDRIDQQTGFQYFYHCHRENLEQREHGHFHTFLRYKHIPKNIKPTPLKDWDKYMDNPMTHLTAIGINQLGQPIRLFTVNRWVTSEIWYDAKHLDSFIKKYAMDLDDDPYWQVLDKWVEGMLRLFSPQIAWLNRAREQRILHYQSLNPEVDPYEAADLEELSELPIDLKAQIEWVLG